MNDETQIVPDLSDIREGDILFDCPHCGKNMAIESAGAGLMVPCANCGRAVQVPIPDGGTPEVPAAIVPRPLDDENPETTIRQLDAALTMANQQIDRLLAEKEALQERRAFLEQMRITNATRYEQISMALSAVQEAIERAQLLMDDIQAEKPA